MNKWIGMGNIGKDVDVRTNGDSTVARFSLAVKRKFAKEGDIDTDWISIVCFGKLATFAEKYLHKGTKVVVVGSVQNDNYTKQDGSQVYSVQIMVDEIEFAESKNSSDGSGAGYQPAQPATGANDFMNIPDGIVEELPFN